MTEGSAVGTRNTQLDAVQLGLGFDDSVKTVTFEQVIDNPFNSIATPANYQNVGLYIGTGDQDNYVKLVAGMNAGPGFEVLSENNAAVASQKYGAAIFGSGVALTALDTITLRMTVDLATGMAAPSWQWTEAAPAPAAARPSTASAQRAAQRRHTGRSERRLHGHAIRRVRLAERPGGRRHRDVCGPGPALQRGRALAHGHDDG